MIGISEELTVIRPGGALSPRCAGVLEAALAGRQAEVCLLYTSDAADE